MKTLKCADLGMTCDFVASGETDQEIKDKINTHVSEAHNDILSTMTEDQKNEMNSKMDELLNNQNAPTESTSTETTPTEDTSAQ